MKRTQEKWKKEKGITLIALVITIVVLLILSGITINMLLGENGIIRTAQEAKNTWESAVANEQEDLENLMNELNSIMNDNSETGGGNIPEEPEDPTKGPNGKPLVDTITQIQTGNNVEAEDKYGNPVVVPKGFKVVVDETTRNATTVPEGIVIEDVSGNQFVWIPTGTYKVDESGTTKTNDLTRREWGTKDVVKEPTLITGDDEASGRFGKIYFGEGDSRSVANDSIGNFLNSAKPSEKGGNGGFYIGRYEQGKGNVCKSGVSAYVSITRDTAKAQAEAMYTNKEQYGVTSELISSYAWDTALNFICQNSEHGYKLATTREKNYGNIGTNSKRKTGETPADCYSNIYDILGNFIEWTTEYSSISEGPTSGSAVLRGGGASSIGYAANRSNFSATGYHNEISFRLSLYV